MLNEATVRLCTSQLSHSQVGHRRLPACAAIGLGMLACMDRDNVLTGRRALTLLTGAGATAVLVVCGLSDKKATAASSTSSSPSTASSSTAYSFASSATAAPHRPRGGHPAGDLEVRSGVRPHERPERSGRTRSRVVRRDITLSSFGSMSGTAEGVPTTVELTITDLAKGVGVRRRRGGLDPRHNDRDGNVPAPLPRRHGPERPPRRGEEADANGKVMFSATHPGANQPRWPHIHFEVYPSWPRPPRPGTRSLNIAAPRRLATSATRCTKTMATRRASP